MDAAVNFGLVAVVLIAIIAAAGAVFAWSRIHVEMRVFDALKIDVTAAQSKAAEARQLVQAWDDSVRVSLERKLEEQGLEIRKLKGALSDCEEKTKSLQHQIVAMKRWHKSETPSPDAGTESAAAGVPQLPLFPSQPTEPAAPVRNHFGRKAVA